MRCALLSLAVIAGAGLAGCESAPPEPTERAVEVPAELELPPPPPPGVFSARRAWDDLEALAALGPRVAGTEGAGHARAFLRARLAGAGLEAEEVVTTRSVPGSEDAASEDVALHHLVVTLPGASPQLFLLVAPYDSSRLRDFEFLGVNDGASGAALLLELARVLKTRSLPYTTRIVFLDGEGRVEGGEDLPAVARWSGSESLAEQMDEQGELEDVRLLVALHRVCDADLRIARDLSSQRMHREEVFKAAERLGRTDAFPRSQGFESPEASHLAFRARGVRATLALVDTRYGGDTVPGVFAESPEDTLAHCSAGSLEAVGIVTLDALETIGRRLAKIDRFARTPLSGVDDGDGSDGTDAGDALSGPDTAPLGPSTGDATAGDPHGPSTGDATTGDPHGPSTGDATAGDPLGPSTGDATAGDPASE